MVDNPWIERRYKSKPKGHDVRSAFQVDYGRIVHSAAFRRLQGKTQILGLGESDFYRTRLTHSIEVAQIGEGIVSHLQRQLSEADDPRHAILPSAELMRSICLIHDIGHPPFGHGGEIALNRQMIDHGGFEGNGMSLRIVARLEQYYPHFGMNLTRRTMLGILKYPVSYSEADGGYDLTQTAMSAFMPPKCYLDEEREIVAWLLSPLSEADREVFFRTREAGPGADPPHRKPSYKALDTSIMDVADDISYGIHDMEDGIALGFIGPEDFEEALAQLRSGDLPENHWIRDQAIGRELFASTYLRKKWISIFVGQLINGVELAHDPSFEAAVLAHNARLNPNDAKVLKAFKDLVYRRVITNPNVCMADFKGQQIIAKLFEALAGEGEKLLPEHFKDPNIPLKRRICDYVACMTDDYAGKLYQKLFHPNFGSIFDHH